MPVIEISSLTHPGVEIFSTLTEAQLRNRLEPDKGLFIAESPKVIKVALDAGYEPLAFLCEHKHIYGDAAEIIERCGDIPVYTSGRELLAELTGYVLTRGVLCAMRRPVPKSMEDVCRGARRIVVIDGVVDTTNIGAIFRSAAALGMDAVLLTRNSCDPLNRRAVRVSMGTVFLVPWTWMDGPLDTLGELGFRTAAMALTDGPVSPAMVNEWKDWAAKQTYTDGYKEDPRLTGSIWSYKALDPNIAGNVLMDCTMDEGEPEYTVSYRYYEQTGYFQKKYININSYNEGKIEPFGKQMFPGISSQTSQQLLQIADLIHIRFADVLLMQSELKQDATGLNKVRARSHLAPVAYSLEAIKQERRWELAFESIRWWDILRWSGPSLEEAGDILNKQTGFNIINAATVVPMVKFDYKKRLQATQGYWPIPQDEIDISNGVLEQNPGWDASAQFSDWNNM